MSPQSDALNWNQKRKLFKHFEPSIKQHPDWPVIISEGEAKMWGIKVGPWMRPNLEAKGITDGEDQRQIIHWLLGRFHELLAAIAQQADVTLVPTVGTLAKSDWNDELHPTRKGFEKIAGKFRTELKKQFPGTF